MLTARQVEEIEREAQAWVDGLSLSGEAAFHAAVESQLERLVDPPVAKRRATALALAEVGLTEATRAGVFRRADTVGHRIFYSKDKDWYYGETFRDVLERLIRLYRKWSASAAARSAAADFQRRLDELREAEYEIGAKMFDVARQMADASLFEVTVTGENGQDVTVKPVRWGMADLPRVAKGASELVRQSLGMAPGGRQEVAVSWTEHLPEGVTEAQAQAAMESWARILAAADRATEGDEDDDDD